MVSNVQWLKKCWETLLYRHHAAAAATHAAPCHQRHSLAKPQTSGMHVALDRLPAPSLAAARHHASDAVTATGTLPSPRAGTPAVTGPQ